MGVILRYKDFLKTYKTRGHRLKHLKDYEKLFPIKSSPELSGIIADLIADGNLQGDPKWRFDFTSKSKKELKRFEKEINNLFNITGKIRKCTTNKLSNSYNIGINCAPIARILFLCGVPLGQKVLTIFNIPLWIKKDKECFRIFCRRFFTCEGGIMHEKNRRIPQIRISLWKHDKLINNSLNFMKDLGYFMKKYFNIDSTIKIQKNKSKRKDGVFTQSIKMYILNKSVIRFYNQIGFESEKQKSLKAILNSSFHGKPLD